MMNAPPAAPWLTVIGVGEDGLEGLGATARAAFDKATAIAGGRRLLQLCPHPGAETIPWSGCEPTIAALLARRGRPVAALVSNDPMHYGFGVALSRVVPRDEMTVLPAPSAYSLAAARMGWAVQDALALSVHGRPLAALALRFAPGRKLMILSRDETSPAAIARLATENGYGPSAMTALAHMGGPRESRLDGLAETWTHDSPRLSVVCLWCRAAPGARVLSPAAGLPDEAYDHDGRLTKRDARAAAVAALGPWPGAVLWDVGAGNGSVGVECARVANPLHVHALERDPQRLKRLRRNAEALGAPCLHAYEGVAPEGLTALPDPDLIFVGGGASCEGVLEACRDRLKPGGRLVAHGATVEAERALLDFRAAHGGALSRIAIAHARPMGRFLGWDASVPITRLVMEKAP